MSRIGYSLFKLLGVEGKKVNIIPTIKGMNLTEIYNKKNEYIGMILLDKRWKKYILVDLDKDMQMSRDCINEAFDLTEKYWKGHDEK
jgi:hypothetical protein